MFTHWRATARRRLVTVVVRAAGPLLIATLLAPVNRRASAAEGPAPQAVDETRITVGHGATAGVRVQDETGDGQTELRIGHVAGNSVASRTGLKEGDRIVTANGCRIRALADWQAVLGQVAAGSSLNLVVRRPGSNATGPLYLTLPAAPRPAPGAPTRLVRDADGLRIQSVAAGTELAPGDLLVAIDGEPAAGLADAEARLGRARRELVVSRDGALLSLPVRRAPQAPAAPCPG